MPVCSLKNAVKACCLNILLKRNLSVSCLPGYKRVQPIARIIFLLCFLVCHLLCTDILLFLAVILDTECNRLQSRSKCFHLYTFACMLLL